MGLGMRGICLLGLAIGAQVLARETPHAAISAWFYVPMRAGSPAQVCRGLLDIRSDAIPPDLFSGFAGDFASVVLGPKTFVSPRREVAWVMNLLLTRMALI